MEDSPRQLKAVVEKLNPRELVRNVDFLYSALHNLPFQTGSINLVVSRGEIYFWKTKTRIINEIFRVFAPGGYAFLGGGFGTPELREKIISKVIKDLNSKPVSGQIIWRKVMGDFERLLRLCYVPSAEITCNDDGVWIVIQKPVWNCYNPYPC